MFSRAHHYVLWSCFISQPDRGAKRPREEDGAAAGGEEDSRKGKHQKGLSARELARYREAEAGGAGTEAGLEMRETVELTGDKKMILEKLMDQDEDEPEVGECFSVTVMITEWIFMSLTDISYTNYNFYLSYCVSFIVYLLVLLLINCWIF